MIGQVIPQIVNALKGITDPWMVLALTALGGLTWLGKKVVDVLFGWPRPEEVDRLLNTNEQLDNKLSEAEELIEEREATIRQQSQKIMRLEMAQEQEDEK